MDQSDLFHFCGCNEDNKAVFRKALLRSPSPTPEIKHFLAALVVDQIYTTVHLDLPRGKESIVIFSQMCRDESEAQMGLLGQALWFSKIGSSARYLEFDGERAIFELGNLSHVVSEKLECEKCRVLYWVEVWKQ
jgi:hypothetical protein